MNIYTIYIYGGDTPHEWRPYLVRNYLCALKSEEMVYNMVISTKNDYDFILYIRPDLNITTSFDIDWLSLNFDIILPNYDFYEGFSNIFVLMPFNKAKPYSMKFNELVEYRKNIGRIVGEKYLKHIVEKYYRNVYLVDFCMNIVRP